MADNDTLFENCCRQSNHADALLAFVSCRKTLLILNLASAYQSANLLSLFKSPSWPELHHTLLYSVSSGICAHKNRITSYNANSNDFSKVATAASSRFTPTFFVGAPVLRLAPLAQHKLSKMADSEKIQPIFFMTPT